MLFSVPFGDSKVSSLKIIKSTLKVKQTTSDFLVTRNSVLSYQVIHATNWLVKYICDLLTSLEEIILMLKVCTLVLKFLFSNGLLTPIRPGVV